RALAVRGRIAGATRAAHLATGEHRAAEGSVRAVRAVVLLEPRLQRGMVGRRIGRLRDRPRAGIIVVTAAARLVCAACRSSVTFGADACSCAGCSRRYPIVHGIPDFRLEDGPYLSIEADRRKALHLAEASATRSFEALVHYYYSITPDDPPD